MVAIAALIVAVGCGHGESRKPPRERADRPAPPPPGWRTFRNRSAGFTLSLPRRGMARVKRRATLIRSRDRLLVITVGVDRAAAGRRLAPARYAKRVLESLPDFEGSIAPRRGVRGSPYRSARVDGVGTIKASKRRERMTVVAFQRRGRATYVVVAFSNAKVRRAFFEPSLGRILRSCRAQPPRSGRSG